MQILITGGAGYIGSVLTKELLTEGHKVRCLDRFFFGTESLADVASHPNLELFRDDIRWFDPGILRNVDVVMDLAAISNDPSGELDPSKTLDINYLGRIRVARLCKEYGVRRYILASSCSIYGFQEGVLNESSPVNPLTTYSKANHKAEQDVLPLANSQFCVTVLRFATVYGYSPRMRFDLAVNAMALGLAKSGQIPVLKDGMQWRPFIHVKDAALAYACTMDHSVDKINGEIFNVGSDEQNYKILQLAEMIGKSLSIPYEIQWYGSPDYRSYKVSFRKFQETIHFKPSRSPREAAVEVFDAIKSGAIVESMKTKTVEWYKHLLASHELNSQVSLRNTIF